MQLKLIRLSGFIALTGGLLTLLVGCRQTAATNGDSNPIPPTMRVNWSAGVEGGIPEVQTVRFLLANELPSPPEDAASVIQAAMDSLEAPAALQLPEGTWLLKQRLFIPDGVVLRGQGAARTHLHIDTSSAGDFWYGAIVLKGEGEETDVPVAGAVEAGARSVPLKDTIGIRPGQLVWLFRFNDPEVMSAGRTEWPPDWSQRSVGQMFRIDGVSEKQLHLDRPVRLDYPERLTPGVRIYTPIRRAGLEGIHFKMLDRGKGGIVTLETAENCWIRDCEFENTVTSHIGMRRSRYISVVNNYVHGGQIYSGGRAYGIGTDWSTSDCLIQNNILSQLRHAISVSIGANGCVWAYNYLRDQVDNSPKDRLRDISLHGNYPYMNLFEGNVAEFASSSDWWGACGPLNTFYRNRFDPTPDDPSGWIPPLQIQYATHRQVVVGNTLVQGQGVSIGEDCRDTFVAANRNFETDAGWDENIPKLPPSLYLEGAPDFWGKKPWPAIGADVDGGSSRSSPMVSLPAQDWYQAIIRAGHTIPFAERGQY